MLGDKLATATFLGDLLFMFIFFFLNREADVPHKVTSASLEAQTSSGGGQPGLPMSHVAQESKAQRLPQRISQSALNYSNRPVSIFPSR